MVTEQAPVHYISFVVTSGHLQTRKLTHLVRDVARVDRFGSRLSKSCRINCGKVLMKNILGTVYLEGQHTYSDEGDGSQVDGTHNG